MRKTKLNKIKFTRFLMVSVIILYLMYLISDLVYTNLVMGASTREEFIANIHSTNLTTLVVSICVFCILGVLAILHKVYKNKAV